MFKLKSVRNAPETSLPRKPKPIHSVADLDTGEVSFHSDGKQLVIEQKNGTARVAVDVEHLPEIQQYLANLSGRCERRAFRVPVHEAFGLRARVGYSREAQIPARVLDISYLGALVELTNWDTRDLATGSRLVMELSLEGEVYRNEPVVQRIADNGYGLFFPESLTAAGAVDPPETLLGIVRRLEEMWVASRQHGD